MRNIKVGDKVIVSNTRYPDAIGTVVKITPSGLIDVVGGSSKYADRFNKDGRQRGAGNFGNIKRIKIAKEDDIKRIMIENDRSNMAHRLEQVNFHRLSYDKLKSICDIINQKEVRELAETLDI